VVLALFSVASATTSDSISSLWGAWKVAHGKQYSSLEDSHRFIVFQNNLVNIAKLNAKNPNAKFAVNRFADLTNDEFQSIYANGLIKSGVSTYEEPESFEITVPTAIDWRNKGAVTPVKDQGHCGSCWAFSATGALEGAYAIKNGELISFSEQQLVDCSQSSGNQGCNGGDMPWAFDYVVKYGIQEESDYPYTAKDGKCQYNSQKAMKVFENYKELKTGSVALLAALATQPIAVSVQADTDFQFYKSGIIESESCGTYLNHGVLAVGFEVVGAKIHYIVKNSWGTTWGEQGYVRILAGKNICGIEMENSYPIVE